MLNNSDDLSDWVGEKWRWVKRWPRLGRVSLGDLHRLTPIGEGRDFKRGQTIDRYYVECFLRQYGADIRGRVLEVGEGDYARRFGSEVTALETLATTDQTSLDQLPDGSLDCLILPQSLQLNYELAAAVKNLHRVVQPGGTVLASFPGIRRMTEAAQEEECYWGVTNMSVHLLFAEPFRAENVAVKSFGNVLSATAYLHGLAADELTKQEMDHEDQEYQVVIGVRAKKT